jgi:N-acyl-D-amino-acid deacylase
MKNLLAFAILLAFSIIASAFSQTSSESFDVLIRNGTVIDGSGQRGVKADVGVRGDRIVFVGSANSAQAKTTIDAMGLVVAPGFIDVHSHCVKGWRWAAWVFRPG